MRPGSEREIIGTGLAFPFRTSTSGSIALATGTPDVEQAIRIILSTTPGERPMRPEFGCNLADLVFEHIDSGLLGRVEAIVVAALDRWEPRITVEAVDVEVVEGDTGTRLLIDIDYLLRETMSPRNLVYPFYVVPAEGEPR